MKINFYIKTYKDKILLLPREEAAWEITNKIFMIKLGWLIWDLRLSFNFQVMYAQLKDKSIVEVKYYDNVDGENLYRDINNSTLYAEPDIIKIILDGSEIIKFLKEAVSIASNRRPTSFTTEVCQQINEYIDNIKLNADWTGCQGTCDFEESFNTTGWI